MKPDTEKERDGLGQTGSTMDGGGNSRGGRRLPVKLFRVSDTDDLTMRLALIGRIKAPGPSSSPSKIPLPPPPSLSLAIPSGYRLDGEACCYTSLGRWHTSCFRS